MEIEYYVKTNLADALERVLKSKRANELPELTIYEKTIIFAYTDTANNQHQVLNDLLWLNQGQQISEFGRCLEICLAKLKPYKSFIYRGVKEKYCDLERYIKAYENKTIITEYHFLSATKSQITARGFGKILFRIYSKNAKSIEKVSKFEKEEELLFQRSTSFKVINLTNNGFSTIITLKEV